MRVDELETIRARIDKVDKSILESLAVRRDLAGQQYDLPIITEVLAAADSHLELYR